MSQIKEIHEKAFYNCIELKSLDLSSLFLLRFIGDEAFCNCKKLFECFLGLLDDSVMSISVII